VLSAQASRFFIDLFGGTELIALDALSGTAKTPGHRKNTEFI